MTEANEPTKTSPVEEPATTRRSVSPTAQNDDTMGMIGGTPPGETTPTLYVIENPCDPRPNRRVSVLTEWRHYIAERTPSGIVVGLHNLVFHKEIWLSGLQPLLMQSTIADPFKKLGKGAVMPPWWLAHFEVILKLGLFTESNKQIANCKQYFRE